MKEDWIQMPPIKRGTDSDVVKMVWEFLQLSDIGRSFVEELLFSTTTETLSEADQLKRFEEEFKKLYRDLIQQSANLTCLVYDCIYNQGRTPGEIIELYPEAKTLITAISIQFDMIMKPNGNYQN